MSHLGAKSMKEYNAKMTAKMFHNEKSIISEHYGFSEALLDEVKGVTEEDLKKAAKILDDNEKALVHKIFVGIDPARGE